MCPDHDSDPAPGREARGLVPPETRPQSATALHVCVRCGGRLVYPFDWSTAAPRHWRVLLRCPECEAIREGLFTQGAVDRLADELDRGAGLLILALDRLTRENMAGEIEVLVHAIDSDLIVPNDF